MAHLVHYPAGHRDDRFWISMGPLFFDKKIKRDLPYLRDDVGKHWFIVFDDKTVVGFAAVEIKKNGVALIGSAWVSDAKRGRGVYKSLTDARLDFAKSRGIKTVRATCLPASAAELLKRGFAEVSQIGKYRTLEKSL
ncbi:MAG: N-acetyltransferase [Azoarcus sp.]|jgi:N-acetylglutamate synthase-like GNAT family acetyltransferase|nr:N-acetyltransferase [Azoarcus sp.]